MEVGTEFSLYVISIFISINLLTFKIILIIYIVNTININSQTCEFSFFVWNISRNVFII